MDSQAETSIILQASNTRNIHHCSRLESDPNLTRFSALSLPESFLNTYSLLSGYSYLESPNIYHSMISVSHKQSSLDNYSTQSSDQSDNYGLKNTSNLPYTIGGAQPVSHHPIQTNRSLSLISNMVHPIMNESTLIQSGKLKFLILDAPSDDNIPSYVEKMRSYGITDLVRTNFSTYNTTLIANSNIMIHDLFFEDGNAPPVSIILKWLDIVKTCVQCNGAIAVHCVAGLGRAPVLVGIALIENGMAPHTAISYIRERRRGALNRIQLNFLLNYKSPKKSNCFKRCHIM